MFNLLFFDTSLLFSLNNNNYYFISKKRQIIEEDLAESQNENGALDFMSEIIFKNIFTNMQFNIEKIAIFHMEFWSILAEDNPGDFYPLFYFKLIRFVKNE